MCQLVALCHGQVRPLILGENGQQIERYLLAVKVLDDSNTPAFAFPVSRPSQLPHAPRTLHQVTRLRELRQVIDQKQRLGGGEQAMGSTNELG
jgi:hypothetical protein